MKITVDRVALSRAIRTVAIASDDSDSDPDAFRFVRMKATGSVLRLTTMSRTIAASMRITADVSLDGELAVPVGILADVLSAIRSNPGTVITIEQRSGSLHISSEGGKNSLRVHGLAPEYMPSVAEFADAKAHRVGVSVDGARSLLRATVHAVANDKLNAWRNCVCLASDGKSIVAIATDGIKLGYYALPTSTPNDFGEVLLPSDAAEKLLRLLPREGEGEFAFPADETGPAAKRLFFAAGGGLTVSTSLADLKFTDWRKSTNNRLSELKERLFVVNREDMFRLVAQMKYFQAYGSISMEGDTATGTATGLNGTFSGKVDISTLRGIAPAEPVLLDLHYLSNAIAAFPSEWIGISMAAATAPVTLCLMAEKETPDTNSIQAISPMRLK